MKRLAYVAYFFPPTGGAGVQRTVKFVRYLPAHGWLPTVITVRAAHYWMNDPTLLSEIPASVSVERTGALTGSALLGWLAPARAAGEGNVRRSGRLQHRLRRIAGWLTVPDPYVGWVPFATRAAARALRHGGVLLTTSSPDSAHLVGLCLARRRVPWVADFRDPWVRRMSLNPPTFLHRRLHQSLEGMVVRKASRIVTTSEATRQDFLLRYPGIGPRRIVVIPNGYDEEDFPREPPPPDESFLVLHLGQLNPERPIMPLLDCLEAFIAQVPDARDRMRVEHLGPRYREDEEAVTRRGLASIVRFRDPLPHREAVRRLLQARVLVLMEQESDRGSLILPGKTFEYLRARRPILGLLPRGAAWDLITETRSGFCALPSDPVGAAAHLVRLFGAYRAGEAPPLPVDDRFLQGFERRALAKRLSDLLDEVAAEAVPPA